MRILVTGGAGYIGSTLVPALLERQHEVVVVDRFFFGRDSLADAVREFPDELTLHQADVRDLDPSTFDGVDAVIDLAGISNDPACELNPQLTRDINLDAAVSVAELAREAGVKRLVFASSCSVYGHGESLELTEDSPLNPVTLYAECKARAEEELLPMSDDDFCVTALRFATVFGLSRRMRFDLAVNIMTKHAYVDQLVRVYGGGTQWRPFVHVRDIARAIVTTLRAPVEVAGGEVFNVGNTANNLQIKTLAYRIRDQIPGTQIEMVPSDPDLRNYNVRFEKIENLLDYRTKYSIEDGIAEIAEALSKGQLDPDDRRWYTLKNYVFLQEVQEVYAALAMDGQLLKLDRG